MTEASPEPAAGRDDRTRLLGTALLTVLGAAVVLFAAGRSWLSVYQQRLAPFGPRTLHFAGHALYPALNGLAIVAVLVAVLVVITGRWPRRLLGLLLSVLALLTGWYGLRAWHSPSPAGVRDRVSGAQVSQVRLAYHPFWPALTVLGSLLLLAAGVLLLARAGRWQVLWSARYSGPAEPVKTGDPWRRLDRGEDPTIQDG